MIETDFFVVMISWLLAAVFASACRHKLVEWQRFRAAFAAYRIVPEGLVGAVAGLVTLTEILVVLALILLWPAGLFGAALLLGVYLVAIGVNLARGRRHIDCGCGDEPTPLSYRLLVRNALLSGLALWAGWAHGTAGVSWAAGFVALVAALVAFGIYMAVEQLIANRGRHERLWLGVR